MVDKSPELHRSPETLADMAANAVCHYRNESGITGHVETKQWIAKVFDKVTARLLTH